MVDGCVVAGRADRVIGVGGGALEAIVAVHRAALVVHGELGDLVLQLRHVRHGMTRPCRCRRCP